MVQINELLGNKKAMELMLFLAQNSSKEFPYTQIRKKTKLAKATLTKWLSYLLKNELVLINEIGRNKLYKLNRDNFLVKQLKIIFNLMNLTFLVELGKEHSIQAYLFGSAARGEDVEESDFDILIIGNIKKEEIIEKINKNTKRLGKDFRLQLFSKLEWSKMMEKDRAFYERVEKDKILLR